jgi:predicted dehydrogenase
MTPPTQSRPLGVGVIGSGFGRSTQIPAFARTPGVEVVAVVSRQLARAYEAAKDYDIRRAFDPADLDRFLKLDDLDLVCVSSPPDTHRDYSLRALAAGKHVLCEKPTAMNAGEARDMAEAARRSGKLALLDHELRFDPTRQKLRDLVRDGFLGRLLHVTIQVESEFRLDPKRVWSWWSDEASGGGILGAIASHVVDAVRYTFGEVVRGRGDLRTMFAERPDAATGAPRRVTADDYAAFWLELDGGAVVSGLLTSVARSRVPGQTISAHGTDGSLVLEPSGKLYGRRADEKEFADLSAPPPPFDAAAMKMPDTIWSRAFVLYAAEIAKALAAGRATLPDAATFEDGLRTQEVLDALRASAGRGDWVECGPGALAGAKASR